MSMKRSMMSILGLAAAFGGLDGMDGFGHSSGSSSRQRVHGDTGSKRYPISRLDQLSDDQLLDCVNTFTNLLKRWNEESSKKLKMHVLVPDTLEIKATTVANGWKRARWFLAESGIEPNTSINDLRNRCIAIVESKEKISSVAEDQNKI